MPVNEIQFGFENKWFELKVRNLTVKIYKDFYRGGSVNIFAEKHPPISYILIALAGPFVNLAFLGISFILYKGLDVIYAFSFVIVNLILLGIAVSDYYLASFAFKQIRRGLAKSKNRWIV